GPLGRSPRRAPFLAGATRTRRAPRGPSADIADPARASRTRRAPHGPGAHLSAPACISSPRCPLRCDVHFDVQCPHEEPLVYLCEVGPGGAGGGIASPTLQSRRAEDMLCPLPFQAGSAAGPPLLQGRTHDSS